MLVVITSITAFMNQMKELGIYDDATIIVTADHGRFDEGVVFPTFVIKRPGAHGAVEVCDTPASQTEVHATILQCAGLEIPEGQTSIFDLDPDADYPRRFLYYPTTYSNEGFLPDLYDSLGIYLTLITVNCIIFGRAEMFASKNGIVASACDAIGMGIGFTLALFLMGSVREIIGAGQWLGMSIPGLHSNPMLLFIMPAGGFFTLGMIIAAVNKMSNKKPPQELGCKGCPNAESCSKNGGECK